MAERLKGKVAIVSGGATGCGAAAVRLFAAEGAAVGIIDRNVQAGQALAFELASQGKRVVFATELAVVDSNREVFSRDYLDVEFIE